METIAIDVRDVRKTFGSRTVLDGLSFSVPKGQVLALVGPSGGGKSTMLRCMTGLTPFEAGSIRVEDASLVPGGDKPNARALETLRARSGLVFQQWHLFAHMTAIENVIEAPLHVKKTSRADAIAKANALLEEVGLGHRANAMPRDMSGGEQQRCAIARALAMEPKVLFMDEPTSALDPQRVGDLVELLAKLRESAHLTLVVVTHEMSFAARLADRAIVLHEGHLIEDGAPRDVLENPTDPRTRSFLGLE